MSNKSFYSFIAFGVIALFVAGFFIVNALTPGVAPNPGHLITQVAPPAGCGSGQVLGWFGSSWGCVALPVDTDTDTWRPTQTLSVSGQTLSISGGNSVSLPSASVCPTGYTGMPIGNLYTCIKEGSQITSDCCYNYGSNECVANPDWCGDAVPGSLSESRYCAPVTYSDSHGTWNLHTWARNNGGILQTRSQIVVVGATPNPYCDSGWVNGNSQCSYWEITAYATVSSSGLQGKLMQGSTTRCSISTGW